MRSSDKLRVARGLLFTVDDDGDAWVWHPQRREHTPLTPDALALLLHFRGGRTFVDAAHAAAIELDDAVHELLAHLLSAQLLVPAAKRVPPRPRAVAQLRLDELLDAGTFAIDKGPPVITGFGRLDGRRVGVAAWEPGALGGVEHVLALQERVLADPCPLVYLLDSNSIATMSEFHGARAIGRIYANQARLSGHVPQIAIVAGALHRPAALLPVGCDVVIFVGPTGRVMLADSLLVKQITGEDVAPDALGGARIHAEHSGLAHLIAASTGDAAALARRYLGFMPASPDELPPLAAGVPPPARSAAELDALVPDDTARPFAMDALVHSLLDEGSPLELRASWARELSTTLGRLDGMPLGVIANCSQYRAGILTVEAADKAARFIASCDSYGIPLLFVVDALGFAAGPAAERAGIERAAGRMFSVVANATVPKLTLVARRAHTSALFAMCGPAFDPDVLVALPTAAISITSERGAVTGVAALERRLDAASRESLRAYLRAARPDPAERAEVVPASRVRDALAHRLRARLAEPGRRRSRPIPP